MKHYLGSVLCSVPHTETTGGLFLGTSRRKRREFEPGPGCRDFQQTEQFRDSGIVTALDVIGMLSLIGDIVLTLALFASEYGVIALPA